jgi:S-adenosylmethionine decarboxylase proenzyme
MMILKCIVSIALLSNLIAEEIHYFAGKHFLASYLDCDVEALSNVPALLEAMDVAVAASGATILARNHHLFPPNGLTVAYLLSESHACLHTYPECGACFVDIFTCGNHCSSEAFDTIFQHYLKPKTVNARMFIRDEGIQEIPLSARE